MPKGKPANGDAPATQADLAHLAGQLTTRIDGLEKKMDARFKELTHHFDVAIENIQQSLEGANKDKISLMQGVDVKQHKRIVEVEEKVGVTPGDPPPYAS